MNWSTIALFVLSLSAVFSTMTYNHLWFHAKLPPTHAANGSPSVSAAAQQQPVDDQWLGQISGQHVQTQPLPKQQHRLGQTHQTGSCAARDSHHRHYIASCNIFQPLLWPLAVASLGSAGRLAAPGHVLSGRLHCWPQYPRNLRGLLDEEEEVPSERLAQGKHRLNPGPHPPPTLADSRRVGLFSFLSLTVIAVLFFCFLSAILPARERNPEILKDTARRKLFTEHHVLRFHLPEATCR